MLNQYDYILDNQDFEFAGQIVILSPDNTTITREGTSFLPVKITKTNLNVVTHLANKLIRTENMLGDYEIKAFCEEKDVLCRFDNGFAVIKDYNTGKERIIVNDYNLLPVYRYLDFMVEIPKIKKNCFLS